MYGFESEGTIRALSEYVSQPDDSEKAGILLAGAKPAPELSPGFGKDSKEVDKTCRKREQAGVGGGSR